MKLFRNRIWQVLGLLVLLALAFLGQKWFQLREKDPRIQLEKQLSFDRALLNQEGILRGEISSDKILPSLIRLAERQESKPREIGLYYVQSENAGARAVAAQVFGYYSDSDSELKLRELLKDASAEVRKAVFLAISRNPIPSRLAWIEEEASKPKEPAESLQFFQTWLSFSREPRVLDRAIDAFIKLGQPSVEERVRVSAIYAAIAAQKEDPRVGDLMRAVSERADLPVSVRAFSLSNLAMIHDSWLQKSWKRLLSSSSSHEVRQALLSTVHLSCSPERFEAIDEFAKANKDPQSQFLVIRALGLLKGQKSVELLGQLGQSGFFSDHDALRRYQSTLHQLKIFREKEGFDDTCAKSAKASSSGT